MITSHYNCSSKVFFECISDVFLLPGRVSMPIIKVLWLRRNGGGSIKREAGKIWRKNGRKNRKCVENSGKKRRFLERELGFCLISILYRFQASARARNTEIVMDNSGHNGRSGGARQTQGFLNLPISQNIWNWDTFILLDRLYDFLFFWIVSQLYCLQIPFVKFNRTH